MWSIAAPLVVLTALPMICCALMDWTSWTIGVVIIVNSAMSGIDLLNVVIAWLMIPAGARVQNDGWRTCWMMPVDRAGIPPSEA